MKKPHPIIIKAPTDSSTRFLLRLARGHEQVGEKVIIVIVDGREYHSELPPPTPFVIKQMPDLKPYIPERKNKTRGWDKNNRKKK